MNSHRLLARRSLFSLLATLIVSFIIYDLVRGGQLIPIPHYLLPCASIFGGGHVCHIPDIASPQVFLFNIALICGVFIFFYICITMWLPLEKAPEKRER